MMKIDELLNRLQEQQPDVSNPDELTGRIMDSLPDLPTEQPKPARRIRLYVASAIAAAASVLLLLTLHYSEEPTSLEAVADLRQGVPTPGKAPADSREGIPTPGKAPADLREGVPTSVEAVQTEHAQQTNRAQPAEPATEVLTERDIPITRPENYKYTPEEIALLKRQAAEAYLKWVELELEIAKHSQEQTTQQY